MLKVQTFQQKLGPHYHLLQHHLVMERLVVAGWPAGQNAKRTVSSHCFRLHVFSGKGRIKMLAL